ncbi:DUF1820 family protein [Pleionea mediterranea]|jgi:hypothetical protein|uniref:DUF1820 family protein n=1 Tax=Pleionea mediterranea TaxID=523701 RepID=A0A316FSR3_9GAMM|nr:DUF1820 family protein [Pleionea mediterranea]PWK51808.1 hypothetical protein C8D97_105123 [Pleionea mediterranea]
MSDGPIYKVLFVNQGQNYEIYARQVHSSGLYGFVEVEQLLFGERAQVVVDPAEEKLKSEFDGVKRSYIPMHAIIRIDEVEKQGTAKVSDSQGGNVVTHFPFPAGSAPKPK